MELHPVMDSHKHLYKATFDAKWKEQFKQVSALTYLISQKCLHKAKLQKEDQLKRFRDNHQVVNKQDLQVDLPNIIKQEWCVNQDFQKYLGLN